MILTSDLCLLLNYSLGRIYNGVVFHPKPKVGKGLWTIYVSGPNGNVLNTYMNVGANEIEICVGNRKFKVDADVECVKQLYGLVILPRYSTEVDAKLLGYADIIGKGTVENKEAYLLRLRNGQVALVSRKTLKELGNFMTVKGAVKNVKIGCGSMNISDGMPPIGQQKSYSYFWK